MNQKRITRRRALRLINLTLGACALTCVGSGLLLSGEETPDHPLPVGFPDITLGDKTMGKKILVAYVSADGSTGGVAEMIGAALSESASVDQPLAVDVCPVKSVAGLDDYRAVVIGSSIHGGKWLPEAVEFVRDHQNQLHQMPTAFFLVGLLVASSSETNRNLVGQYLEAERALVTPLAEGRFVGALFPSKYPLLTGFGMRFFIAYCGLGLRGGDFRDPAAIRAWAKDLYPKLVQQ